MLRPYLWATALVVLIEAACWCVLPRSALDIDLAETRERLETEAAPDAQIMGDSVAAGGLLADLVGNEASVVRNSALQATSPAYSYFLLRAQLKTGRKPAHVIFAHHPRTFATIRAPLMIGSFAHWSEVPELIWAFDGSSDANYGVLTRMSYLLRHRDQLRHLITQGDTKFLTEPLPTKWSEQARIAHFHEQLKDGTLPKSVLDAQPRQMYRDPFTVSPQNDYYFRKLLMLAKDEGIQVYWIALPVIQRLQDLRASTGHDEQLRSYLDPFVRHGELSMLIDQSPVYPEDHFEDWSHVNMNGALRFSCYLGYVWRKERLGAAESVLDYSRLAPICRAFEDDVSNREQT